MTNPDVLDFIVECIGEAEADGYQQCEKLVAPDDWWHDGKHRISFNFAGQVFDATITRRNKLTEFSPQKKETLP